MKVLCSEWEPKKCKDKTCGVSSGVTEYSEDDIDSDSGFCFEFDNLEIYAPLLFPQNLLFHLKCKKMKIKLDKL